MKKTTNSFLNLRLSRLFIVAVPLMILALSSCKKDEPNDTPDTPADVTVKDICGNTYKCVKIGEQYWMAENLRCNNYDTESGRAGDALKTTEDIASYAPYYADASDKSKWNETIYTQNLTLSDDQISKLGYLYNWAAAVGLEDETAAKQQTKPFDKQIQGICPNGWHVPTKAEWEALGVALGGAKDKDGSFPGIGKKLKTTSGWYDNGSGTDDCLFAALPAGYAYGSKIADVGARTFFWTANPEDGAFSYLYILAYHSDLLEHFSNSKYLGYSVRCVKN